MWQRRLGRKGLHPFGWLYRRDCLDWQQTSAAACVRGRGHAGSLEGASVHTFW